ncbi:LOW QUALITY PROTEIN: hypothetical protein Cgig2_008017 [Carnegiea gigantea]|uniref:Uncharacterized protein n=1 Tax=Carnegiea gigantea TaxID=171969 RepID=A0A9Q1QRW0_9CARY|nr:LOW QUALITY PROTEIN: hypothetical protein Cgig2_008017 [Carnegiea gigantea]
MTFSCSLSTKEMAEYIVRHFKWDRYGVAFPSSPLSKDFQTFCPNYELAMAEEAAEHFKLPELPHVIFYAILLNDAETLGVLHGRVLRTLESAPIELHWSTFESWSGSEQRLNQRKVQGPVNRKRTRRWSRRVRAWPLRGRPPLLTMTSRGRSGIPGEETRQRTFGMPLFPFIMAFPSLYDIKEMADYAILHLALKESHSSALSHSRRLPRHMPTLLITSERAAADFELPEMVQATFYAMLLNEAVKLGVVRRFIVKGLKTSLVGLRWSCFEARMSCTDHKLREA